jgi:hypothetical protein
MATTASQEIARSQIAQTLRAIGEAEGSASHNYLVGAEAFSGKHIARDLADSIHHLCMLHGRHPGVIDHAGHHTADGAARGWIMSAIEGFAVERSLLAKLVVASGPLPSTPGQAETEAAVGSQRHALDMLAQSDRHGCALGAAAALTIDWWAMRRLVEKTAKRFSVDIPECALPTIEETLSAVRAVSVSTSIERAVLFGAQQLFGQHRGLWDLLEARQVARGDY